MTSITIQHIGTVLFAIAILHTFSTKFFENLAHKSPRHAGVWHLLGEVEVVFGFWAMILMIFMFVFDGKTIAVDYIDTRNFTEPMFVFAIMVIAGTRPILELSTKLVEVLAKLLPWPETMSFYFVTLFAVPLLGSFITEPAAMTLAAFILAKRIYGKKISERLKYATLGVLFVNVSIGGTLTPFAAPPVLMVANTWQWDMGFMLTHFGWRAAIAVFVNALIVTLLFAKELKPIETVTMQEEGNRPVPAAIIIVHLLFLAGVVVFSHHPAIFMGLFLFFLGVTAAYPQFQNRLIVREGLLVAFFLAGLVVLGGVQQWWLKPLLMSMSDTAVYFGATALTAVTDNAALTYLGSTVDGLSDSFKYALVAGAVTGGGLTVIANAPNPAGIAILRNYFEGDAVNPLGLLLAALAPTLVAIVAFYFIPSIF
ncbi:putative Na+/H+ antiporter [Thiolinea disciformis]|uniref:putative Na+/H+ antiporter n=1 Tax=Thiolinea disciformis TaxID=125614 RepID=UPI0003738AA2|nr:putative Na+/H+ antiporter [Thiolinea disciformis]